MHPAVAGRSPNVPHASATHREDCGTASPQEEVSLLAYCFLHQHRLLRNRGLQQGWGASTIKTYITTRTVQHNAFHIYKDHVRNTTLSCAHHYALLFGQRRRYTLSTHRHNHLCVGRKRHIYRRPCFLQHLQ